MFCLKTEVKVRAPSQILQLYHTSSSESEEHIPGVSVCEVEVTYCQIEHGVHCKGSMSRKKRLPVRKNQ